MTLFVCCESFQQYLQWGIDFFSRKVIFHLQCNINGIGGNLSKHSNQVHIQVQVSREGYSVQNTLRGCATTMGNNISLLVYEWPLIKCKIWYMNGSIFSKFSQIWAQTGSNLRKCWKNQVILLKIWPKIEQIGIWMGHFFLKIVICMELLSNSTAAHPYQNPWGISCIGEMQKVT